MADTVAAPPSQEVGAKKKGKRKLMIGAVVLILVAGFGVKTFLLGGDAAAEAQEPAPVEEGAVLPVAEMTANLRGSATNYARVSFAAVLNAEADEAEVTAKFPLLEDAALSVLLEFDAAQLRTPEGADQLRARLSDAAAEIWPEDEILRIVLTELLVQ